MGSIRITRRALLVGGAQSAGIAALGCGFRPMVAGAEMEQLRWPQMLRGVWDAHGHLSGTALNGTPEQRIEQILKYADRMGIERVIVFMGYPFLTDPTPDEVRHQNDQVLRAIDHSQGRALGFVYLNPKHTAESLNELDRCVRDGPMVGVKLWVALRCHAKQLAPIVERAVELKAPILQHTWNKTTGNLPGESIPSDLAQLAARHPTASFIAAHIGGQWEQGIRAIRASANVVAEICGSDPTAGLVEMAVRELGTERVVYGSDFAGRSFASQLAKVYSAEISEKAKHLILAGNIQRLLQPILAAKGMLP